MKLDILTLWTPHRHPEKGMNFSIAPSHFPMMDFVALIEHALQKLPAGTADATRSSTLEI